MDFQLPHRPLSFKQPHEQPFTPSKTSTPEQNALLKIKETGLLSLAARILHEDEPRKAKKGPFMVDNALVLITNTLLSIPCGWITLILKNRIHRVWRPDGKQYQRKEDGAAIYGLVLCGESGEIPSANEMDQAFELMSEYIQSPGDDDPQTPIDDIAAKLDAMSPTDKDKTNSRDWRQAPGALAAWKLSKGAPRVHPRRYCHSSNARQWTALFIQKYRDRAAAATGTWSLCAIGWTKDTIRRKQSHLTHQGLTHQVERLLETILFHLFPDKRYFLRFTILCPIFDPYMAPVAEHVFSILASAYNRMGGLNGKDSGDATVGTMAIRQSNRIWLRAAAAVQKDYIYASKEIMEQQVVSSILSQWPNEGDELVSLGIEQSLTTAAEVELAIHTDETIAQFFLLVKANLEEAQRHSAELKELWEYIEIKALMQFAEKVEREIEEKEANENAHGTKADTSG